MYKFEQNNSIDSKAFTLIELLLVIALIGILAGVLIAVIDPSEQQSVAEDGVRRSNLQKAVASIESHFAVEGTYPTSTSQASLTTYLQNWPDGAPAGTTYNYWSDSSTFCTSVVLDKPLTGAGLKYCSVWGDIRECNDLGVNNTNCM